MTRMIIEDTLRMSLPFWRHLSEAEKARLIASSMLWEHKPRTLIHHCTDANSPGIQIVRRGRARVFISSPDGKQLTLQRIEPHQLFAIGVSCVLTDTIFDVSLETETQCEVLLIPRATCKNLFDTNLLVKTATLDILSSKFAAIMRILEAIAFTSTRSRLANTLIEHSFLAGSPVINVTHASIAADLGTTREVVTRLLNRFQNDGLVRLRPKIIQIDDQPALMAIRGEYLGHISALMYPAPVPSARSANSPPPYHDRPGLST